MSAGGVSVILPVRDMAPHIEACVAALAPQLGLYDEIIVVDDGSSDGSGTRAAKAGARVIRQDQSGGPYKARNLAATKATNDLLLFVDARSRAKPGLLDAHRALLGEAPLSCTDVDIKTTSTLAGRITAVQDPFRVRLKVTGRGLDFFPTANLGVTRAAFDSVGGFRAIRSGADADLCWRIQWSGLGPIAVDPRVLMDWVPRDTFPELCEQNYRYGKSSVYLERLHANAYADSRRSTHDVLEPAPDSRPVGGGAVAIWGAKAVHLVFRAGRVRGYWLHRDVKPHPPETASVAT